MEENTSILWDRLAVRADALPRGLYLSIGSLLSYHDGKVSYENLQKTYVECGGKPLFGFTNDRYSKIALDAQSFEQYYAPELAFLYGTAQLCSKYELEQQRQFTVELEPILQAYVSTEPAMPESIRLQNLIRNRARSSPTFLQNVMRALLSYCVFHRVDIEFLSCQVVIARKLIILAKPEIKEILEESYFHEVELVTNCLKAIGKYEQQIHSGDFGEVNQQLMEQLRKYAATRVKRKRFLAI